MLTGKSKLLAAIVIVGVIGVAMSVWARSIFTLPSPAQSSRMELGRWLVSRNMEFEPNHVQLQLIDRIESELRAGWKPAASLPLTAAQQTQLAANVRELKFQWFAARCRQFNQLPIDNRVTFLDKQISFVQQLQSLPGSSASESLFDEIDQWRERIPAENRPTVEYAVSATVLRWLQTEPLDSLQASQIVTLAERIANRLDEGMDQSASPLSKLSPDQSDTWNANVDTLMRTWFQSQADASEHLPEARRLEFASGVVARLRRWDLKTILGSDRSIDGVENPANVLGELARRIDTWITNSDEQDGVRLRHFRSDLQRAVLAELIRGGRAFLR